MGLFELLTYYQPEKFNNDAIKLGDKTDYSNPAYRNYSKIYDAEMTHFSPKQEIVFQMAKANSPFANDSGVDYDLRGFYQKYGTLVPSATNGHLTDEFKTQNHPTFSIESNYYNGEPYAVNWLDTKKPYRWAGDIGLL